MTKIDHDLYETLGVPRNASTDVIKKAYKKLAMTHHPDRGGNEETFKKISEAYAVLSDSEKRSMYDRFGSVDMADVQMPDISDIMENLFGFSFMGGGGGGFSQAGRQRTRRSADRHDVLELDLEQVYAGASVAYHLKRRVLKNKNPPKCTVCGGKGVTVRIQNFGFIQQQVVVPCEPCRQTGFNVTSQDYDVKEETLQITIPKGISNGHVIELSSRSDEEPGCSPGSVMLTIRYKKHPIYHVQRETNNLILHVDVTIQEALCGFRHEVRFLDGRILRLHLPRGTVLFQRLPPKESDNDDPFRLYKTIPGMGLSTKTKKRNLLVCFTIHMPLRLESDLINNIEQNLRMKSLTTTDLSKREPAHQICEVMISS